MIRRNFDVAVRFWRAHRENENVDWDLMEQAEATILDRKPRSAADVAPMLEVIVAQGGSPRCDGRDWQAMERIGVWLTAAMAQGQSIAESA